MSRINNQLLTELEAGRMQFNEQTQTYEQVETEASARN